MFLLPRARPVESVFGLIPPLDDFNYLGAAASHPFAADARSYSAVNASWLADLSFLVYGAPGFIDSTLARTLSGGPGYTWDWLGDRTSNRGIVIQNDAALIVVFRGTRLTIERTLSDLVPLVVINQDDLITDGTFFPAAFQAGGHVHAGFATAFAEVAPRLDALLKARKPGQRLWLTGHSLGGALATLAASHVGRDAVQGLYTFGSPRVGDARFTATLPEESHYRFVHRDDVVPTVPPAIGERGYVHGGMLITLEGDGPRSFLGDLLEASGQFASALGALAQAKRLDLGPFPFRVGPLADHAPVYYATLLWNMLAATA